MSDQITTLSILSFEGLSSKISAFRMMRDAHALIENLQGVQFYKLMGSGKGKGFNPFPDWGTYALLICWESMAYAKKYEESDVLKKYQEYSSAIKTYYMENIKSHGLWDQLNPFDASHVKPKDNDQIAVITRATIKPTKLIQFWSFVPKASKPIHANTEGLIFTKGIGEVPVLQMATFSIWKSLDALKNYAYQSKEHREAIQKTRKINWYKEELFARFIIRKKTEFSSINKPIE